LTAHGRCSLCRARTASETRSPAASGSRNVQRTAACSHSTITAFVSRLRQRCQRAPRAMRLSDERFSDEPCLRVPCAAKNSSLRAMSCTRSPIRVKQRDVPNGPSDLPYIPALADAARECCGRRRTARRIVRVGSRSRLFHPSGCSVKSPGISLCIPENFPVRPGPRGWSGAAVGLAGAGVSASGAGAFGSGVCANANQEAVRSNKPQPGSACSMYLAVFMAFIPPWVPRPRPSRDADTEDGGQLPN